MSKQVTAVPVAVVEGVEPAVASASEAVFADFDAETEARWRAVMTRLAAEDE